MTLHPKLKDELTHLHQAMLTDGQIPSREQLHRYYATFRDHFSPERLSRLDGHELLTTMHAHGNRESLVYWLEFKNDDEFPGIFGSISGGSALKFGIYQRKEDGAWMTGSPQNQIELTTDEAVAIARRHREQLLHGVDLLQQFPERGDDAAYLELQKQMNAEAPDVCDTAWGHKYFSLLFPDRLDDYHVANYQRFHLVKLLQTLPEGDGRFLCAGRYVRVASELDIPLNHLTAMLNQRNGRPYSYWRIGTKLGGVTSRWDLMRENNCVVIGWPDLGDLSYVSYNRESKERIRAAFAKHYPNDNRLIGRKTQEIFHFITGIAEGDLVLPSDGATVLGIGRVVGEYSFANDSDAPHRRSVEWLSLTPWKQPSPEGLQTTVYSIRKHSENQVEAEKFILEPKPHNEDAKTKSSVVPQPVRLTGIPGRIQSILTRKKQVILYGPPGTGKTYWARHTAEALAALANYGRSFDDLTDAEQRHLLQGSHDLGPKVRVCTFHPAYGYEDFLEGYRPHTVDRQLSFEQRDGIFKKLCDEARQKPQESFYLIIDEINRGDIPRIFGELITILENDKRGQTILLPLSGKTFSVPENVFVIGTMNTADRSIALLDTALRRRFGFIELMPDSSALQGAVVAGSIPLGPWLDSLNERLLAHVGRDARNLQIGHAYLLEKGRPVTDFGRFARIVQEDIVPLLEEYCYEDYAALAQILGDSLVDVQRQRIRHELFAPNQRDNLLEALLSPSPDLVASARAVAVLGESDELTEEENGDEEVAEEQE